MLRGRAPVSVSLRQAFRLLAAITPTPSRSFRRRAAFHGSRGCRIAIFAAEPMPAM
jgi:hypothetical protein